MELFVVSCKTGNNQQAPFWYRSRLIIDVGWKCQDGIRMTTFADDIRRKLSPYREARTRFTEYQQNVVKHVVRPLGTVQLSILTSTILYNSDTRYLTERTFLT